MFIIYTLIYFLVLYFGPTMEIVFPRGMIILSLLREFYLVFVFFYFFYSVSMKKKCFFTSENILFTLCCIFSLPFILPAGIGRGIIVYILFFSGPFLFLAISNLKFSESTIHNYHYFLYYLLNFLCIGGLLLYFIQNKIVQIFGYSNFDHFFLTDGSGKLRLFGLGFHPTTTGFLYIYSMGYMFFNKSEYIKSGLFFIANWLSHTRSAFFGIPSYIFFKSKKIIRSLILFPAVAAILVVYLMFMNKSIYKYVDTSTVVHLLHLFVLGPQTVFQYPFGAGLGRVSPYCRDNFIIHLESDLYLFSIQVGIINLVLYISGVIVIINKLRKDNSVEAKYLLFILLTFMLGCIIFPLHSLRFTSNFVFIELGFYFSKKNFSTSKEIKTCFQY